jgi:hypothetical protein
MGVPYLGDGPALAGGLFQISGGIGRIDGGGLAGQGFVNQIPVIVVETGKLVYFDLVGHAPFPCRPLKDYLS